MTKNEMVMLIKDLIKYNSISKSEVIDELLKIMSIEEIERFIKTYLDIDI